MSVYYKWNASAAWTIAAQEEMCAFSDETGLREPIARKAFSLLRRFAGGLLNFYRDVYAPPASMEQIKRS